MIFGIIYNIFRINLSFLFLSQNIEQEILRIVRQTDRKQIIFYNDRSLKFDVEKEFQQLWRNTSVDGLQDDNIDEYLNKQVSWAKDKVLNIVFFYCKL